MAYEQALEQEQKRYIIDMLEIQLEEEKMIHEKIKNSNNVDAREKQLKFSINIIQLIESCLLNLSADKD